MKSKSNKRGKTIFLSIYLKLGKQERERRTSPRTSNPSSKSHLANRVLKDYLNIQLFCATSHLIGLSGSLKWACFEHYFCKNTNAVTRVEVKQQKLQTDAVLSLERERKGVPKNDKTWRERMMVFQCRKSCNCHSLLLSSTIVMWIVKDN